MRGEVHFAERVYLLDLCDKRGLSGVERHVPRDPDGRGGAANTPKNLDEMHEFWKETFDSDIHSNNSVPITTVGDSVTSATWGVITQGDIKRSGLSGKTAPGFDGVPARLWKSIPRSVRALYYNVISSHGVVVPRLTTARTTFIPNVKNPSHPGH